MTARFIAFVIWAAAAATAVFWILRLFASSPDAPPHAVAADVPSAAHGDLGRLLGTDRVVVEAGAPPPGPSRYKLLGVVAPEPGAQPRVAVALISVDDKPPRAFRVGSVVDEGLVVQVVQPRRVELGPRGAPAEVRLDLPGLDPAAVGAPPEFSRRPAGVPPQPAMAPAEPPQFYATPPAVAPPQYSAMPPAEQPQSASPPPGSAPSQEDTEEEMDSHGHRSNLPTQ